MRNPETAARLSEAMAISNMTAKELSDKSGVSESSISQYLHGLFAPRNKTAAKLADVLHVNPMWLMGFDVPMEIPEPQLTGYPHVDFGDSSEKTVQSVRRLLTLATLLNDYGMEKLQERAEELTEMNKYRKDGDD